jgi:hypothetical protein
MNFDPKALLNEARLSFGELPGSVQKQFQRAATEHVPIQVVVDGSWVNRSETKVPFCAANVYRISSIFPRLLLNENDAPAGFRAELTRGAGCKNCDLCPRDGLPKVCCPSGNPSKAQCSERNRKDGVEVVFKEKSRPEPWMKSENKIRVVHVAVSGQYCVLVVQKDITTMVLTLEEAKHLGSLLS